MPSGIFIRKYPSGKQAIRISFTYKGVKCQEVLYGLDPSKTAHIKTAEQRRSKILLDIQSGSFDYAKEFPKSGKVKIFYKTPPPVKKILMSELLDKTLADYTKMHDMGNRSIATLKSDTKILNNLRDYFGKIYIQDLKPTDIEKWMEREYTKQPVEIKIDPITGEEEKPDQRKIKKDFITPKTMTNLLTPLKKTLVDAVKFDYIKESPLDKITIKDMFAKTTKKSTKKAIDVFSDDEENKIIDSADGQLKNLIEFGFWTGLRIGELLGLEWSAIDFTNNIIHVYQSKVHTKIKPPKSHAGIRDVPLFPRAKNALMRQKEFTFNNPDGFIFNDPTNSRAWYSSNKLGVQWQEVMAKSGVRYRKPYTMRHSFASKLLTKGEIPIIISHILGHADTTMLYRHYGTAKKPKGGYQLLGTYDDGRNTK